jgi:hypothetical protein
MKPLLDLASSSMVSDRERKRTLGQSFMRKANHGGHVMHPNQSKVSRRRKTERQRLETSLIEGKLGGIKKQRVCYGGGWM